MTPAAQDLEIASIIQLKYTPLQSLSFFPHKKQSKKKHTQTESLYVLTHTHAHAHTRTRTHTHTYVILI